MQRKQLIIAIVAGLGLSGAIAYAANRGVFAPVFSAPVASIASVSTPAASPFTATSHGSSGVAYKPAPPPVPPTDADVGDAASFGRNVRWLGVANGFTEAFTDCASEDPSLLCQQIDDVTATTNFALDDIARIKLPARASNSLLCHWINPLYNATFQNPTAETVIGSVRISNSLTIENPMLADPALINPTTGAPFGGSLKTQLPSIKVFQTAIPPNASLTQMENDSLVCQGGLISKRRLIDTYGFTQAQADNFFAQPMTVKLNVSGSIRYVGSASFQAAIRIVGD